MQFTIKGRRFNVEPQPIILASLILGWAIYYYFSTVNTPHGGADSVLFIKPLTIMLVFCFIFVVMGAVKIDSEKAARARLPTEASTRDRGFLDPRRIFFAVFLVVYCAGMTFFGYLIPSILFVFIVCYYLGVRSVWILIGVPIGLSALLSLIFKTLMKVPIPIWPSW